MTEVLVVPVAVMVPHAGLQVVSEGKGIVVVGVPWVIRKVTPWFCRSFVRLTVKFCCSPVGTVAVAGVRVTEMPESRVKVAVPFFFVSSTEVAVIMI